MAFEQLVAEAAAKKEKKTDKKAAKDKHPHSHGSEASAVAGDVPNVPKVPGH